MSEAALWTGWVASSPCFRTSTVEAQQVVLSVLWHNLAQQPRSIGVSSEHSATAGSSEFGFP